MALKEPQKAVRGRSGFFRKRPLTWDFPLSG